jgi:hypothetical protein
MYSFESQVRVAVASGQVVDYSVTPLYRGAATMPEAVQVVAQVNGSLLAAVTILNR